MFEKQVIPSVQLRVLPPPPQPVQLQEGMLQGVYFTVPLQQREWMLAKIEQWFAERDEIIFISSGETHKQQQGYILLEWEGVGIDPLFLAILTHEEMVDDYTIYLRAKEVE